MHRGLCVVLSAAAFLCGCGRKDAPAEPNTATVQTPRTSEPPVESNAPDSPATSEHPIVTVTREFLQAVTTGNYSRALARSVPGEVTQQGLMGLREAFQWDQAVFTQVWAGAEQAAVITSFIPARQGTATVAWAFNLVATEDGHWLVRLYDPLPNQQIVEDYLAALHEVAPDAKAVDL
jgi:hypothetical protein